MALLIPATGDMRPVVPPDQRAAFTLAELQAFVGGHIEVLRIPDGRVAFLNEEGKLLNLPHNRLATALLAPQLQAGDWIAGDVVICTLTEAGEDTDTADELFGERETDGDEDDDGDGDDGKEEAS